jgi:hypothetical protein
MRALGSIIAILFVLAALPIPSQGDINPDPSVRIRILQREQEVRVSPDENGSVTFTGVVEADTSLMPKAQILTVELLYVIASPLNWETAGTDKVVLSNTADSHSFACTVTVPSNERVERGILEVHGTWTYEPGPGDGDVQADQVMIHIMPYSHLSITATAVWSNAYVDDEGEFRIYILNIGNRRDNVTVDIRSGGDLSIERNVPDVIRLYPGNEYSFTLAASSHKVGIHRIEIWVSGLYPGNFSVDNITLELIVEKRDLGDRAGEYMVPGMLLAAIAIVATAIIGYYLYRKKRR